MGAQKTIKAISRSTLAACGLRYIEENFDKETGVQPPSTAHTYLSAEKDQNEMISIVCGLKPFQHICQICQEAHLTLWISAFSMTG